VITSRMIYGSGTPTDLSRVNATRAKRQYALRSANALQGRTVEPDPQALERKQRLLFAQLQREHERELERIARERIAEIVTRGRVAEQYN